MHDLASLQAPLLPIRPCDGDGFDAFTKFRGSDFRGLNDQVSNFRGLKSGEILKFGVGEDMAEVIYCVYANRGVDEVVEAVMGMERGWAGGEKGREERNKKMREKNPRSKLITQTKYSNAFN
ncbi:hypothetical protein Csa_013625 [Cucumis sativus]|uniref:Uncharacterized protein n=1 Tax=Cucumis sativus TaxID=3659 RepID=A0A0A0LTM9_CUCSA|nr:hypothetical protein Csa_013625 [Cucumis sativus]